MYRIYTKCNLADTWRDPDDIRIVDIGYRSTIEEAKSVAEKYIKEHFFDPTAKLKETEDGGYYAVDFRSYGVTIIISLHVGLPS